MPLLVERLRPIQSIPASGDDWVALLIREVTQSTGIDDAKVRASKVLEALEQALSSRAREEAGKIFQEVNLLVGYIILLAKFLFTFAPRQYMGVIRCPMKFVLRTMANDPVKSLSCSVEDSFLTVRHSISH